jgi:hypothetical protein
LDDKFASSKVMNPRLRDGLHQIAAVRALGLGGSIGCTLWQKLDIAIDVRASEAIAGILDRCPHIGSIIRGDHPVFGSCRSLLLETRSRRRVQHIPLGTDLTVGLESEPLANHD